MSENSKNNDFDGIFDEDDLDGFDEVFDDDDLDDFEWEDTRRDSDTWELGKMVEEFKKLTPNPEFVIASLLEIEPADVIAHPERRLGGYSHSVLSYALDNLELGEPLGYVLEYVNFHGHEFYVNELVLIPRPETEFLVDETLKIANKSKNDVLRIADIGTGSGCIAGSLAVESANALIAATDISDEALDVARLNLTELDVSNKVDFVWGDLLNPFLGGQFSRYDFDIIVANLPYVDPKWDWLDHEKLCFEPEIALYANNHGLAVIRKIISQFVEFNLLYGPKKRYLLLESDPSQKERINKFARGLGLKAETKNDWVSVISS